MSQEQILDTDVFKAVIARGSSLVMIDMLRCESGGTLKRLRCSGLKARSLCDGGSITQRVRPPQSEVQLQFCDDPPIAHTLRCQNAADEMFVGSHAQ